MMAVLVVVLKQWELTFLKVMVYWGCCLHVTLSSLFAAALLSSLFCLDRNKDKQNQITVLRFMYIMVSCNLSKNDGMRNENAFFFFLNQKKENSFGGLNLHYSGSVSTYFSTSFCVSLSLYFTDESRKKN